MATKKCYYPVTLYYMLNANQQQELVRSLFPQCGMDPDKPYESRNTYTEKGYEFEQETDE